MSWSWLGLKLFFSSLNQDNWFQLGKVFDPTQFSTDLSVWVLQGAGCIWQRKPWWECACAAGDGEQRESTDGAGNPSLVHWCCWSAHGTPRYDVLGCFLSPGSWGRMEWALLCVPSGQIDSRHVSRKAFPIPNTWTFVKSRSKIQKWKDVKGKKKICSGYTATALPCLSLTRNLGFMHLKKKKLFFIY